MGISYRRIRDLGVRLLDAQEIERARIALELHDDVSQKIALLKIGLHAALETIPPDRAPLVEEAVSRVQDIATTVHDLSHRLHPAKLRLIGFAPAIRGLLREIGHANMTITFTEDHLPPTLPPVTMLCLYRVVQEALQNIVKYSHARDVAVRVTAGAHGLLLTIADDGIGFDVEAAWGKGLGLISMKERLEALGGRLEVRSMPEHGTFLKASVPADALTPSGDARNRRCDGNPMSRPKVLLADDHALILGAFAKLLSADCDIVGQVHDGRSLLTTAERLKPDVVVLDISMPLLNGLEAGRRLKRQLPNVKLIFLTMNEDVDVAAEAFRAGASGYLLKRSEPSELGAAISAVMQGRSYITPLITADLVQSLLKPNEQATAPGLTPRQREILQLLAEGRSMKDVAVILNLSTRTVAFHKYEMMKHLNIKSTAELIRYAVEHHVV